MILKNEPAEHPADVSFELDRATALETLGDGHFAGRITRDFWVAIGPNGGYLAAIALRGALLALADAARAPRSMHVRYLAPPREGELELRTSVVRAGRSMTTLDASLRQAGREFMTASFCFSAPFSGPAFQDGAPPEALPIAHAIPLAREIPLNDRFDARTAIGAGSRAGARAETGGYLRLADGRPVDMLALAAFWDSWPPALFFRALEPEWKGGMPTVEASVYFRRPVPFAGFRSSEHVLIRLRSALAHDGFVEEDGEIWSLDGQLLVQSRQLALCR
jgi:acyl-CoA thioesterase